MEVVRQKNAATYIVFPIVDADGDLVTGASSLDSELDSWTDGAAPDGFTDCTNEATEIGSTGMYYLSLTQTEMNNDYIVIQVKTATSGAKTQVILIRTMVGDPLNVAVTDDGTAINVASGVVEAQVKSIDNNVITANSIAADAIGASELAADAVAEIQSGLSTLTQANIRTAVGLASANLDTQLGAIDDFLDTEIAAIKAKTDNLPSDPADASDIAASFTAVNNKLDTIDDFLDTEVAAIKAKTDNLPASPAATGDIPSAASVADAVWEETLADHSGTVGSTAEALDNAGGGASPSAIADAVWDEPRSGHTTDGTFGKYLDAQVSTMGSVAIQGKGMPKAQAKDIAEKVWEVSLGDRKAKDVLLAKSEFDPHKDKVMIDEQSQEVLNKITGLIEGLNKGDTTDSIFELISVLQSDYSGSFSDIAGKIASVEKKLELVMPVISEFQSTMKSFQGNMGLATKEVAKTLNQVSDLQSGFDGLQVLMDKFKDKLEEQTDMDKRFATIKSVVDKNELTRLKEEIEKAHSDLAEKLKKVATMVAESKFDIIEELTTK